MVWVRVRVTCGYDIMMNMSTAARVKLQTAMWKFSPTLAIAQEGSQIYEFR